MRRLLGISAVILGGVGVLLCATAIVTGWWAATRTSARLDRAAVRLDHGLSEIDVQLTRVESRVSAILANLDAVRSGAETMALENPDLPRVRAEIERLLNQLVPAIERVDALADSLRSTAAGLRTAADLVDQVTDNPDAAVRVRDAGKKIDLAAEALNGLAARVEASKSAKAVRLTRELAALASEAIAGCELLTEGLAVARREIVVGRKQTAEWRDSIVAWIYVAAIASTLVWLWGGVSQLCLIGWGRRRFDSPAPVADVVPAG